MKARKLFVVSVILLIWGQTPARAAARRLEGAAMLQITDWLEKLGMSEYAERFAENGIDVSVLRYLTGQDLKDIGVLLVRNVWSRLCAALVYLLSGGP